MGKKNPELVACPWCGAKPGERCFTEHKGQRYPLYVRAHASRYEALNTTQERRQQMINKTFNSDSTDGRSLEVGRNGERPWLNIREFDLENTMFMLAPSDAPALALAILEAAGAHKDSQDFLGGAVEQLRFHIGEQERVTAEARERAELEAEALELENAGREAQGVPLVESMSDLTASARKVMLAVARRAREMRAEK